MKKIKKIAAGLMAVAAMATSMASLSASASTLGNDNGVYCSWQWGIDNLSNEVYAKTTNITGTIRICASGVTVYQDGTGAYITYAGDQKTGGNGTVSHAKVSRYTYSSNGYNFVCDGCIYNGNHPYSGVAESWPPKYIA